MAAQPWEQRGNESAKAFAALRAYLDLGTGRSLDALANARAPGGTQEGTRKAPGNLRRWSARHGWTERAAAWDRHLDALRTRAAEAEAAKQGRRWQQRRDELNERTFKHASRMIDKAGVLVSLPVVRKTVSTDGTDVTYDPLPLNDLVAGAALLIRADALARGAVLDALALEGDALRRDGSAGGADLDGVGALLDAWRADQRAKIVNRPTEPPANGAGDGDGPGPG